MLKGSLTVNGTSRLQKFIGKQEKIPLVNSFLYIQTYTIAL